MTTVNNSTNTTYPIGQNSSQIYGTDSGAANAYVVAVTPAQPAYVAGLEINFVATHTNTGASTLNVSGLGVKNITKDGTTALVSGDIAVNQMLTVIYDGTRFQLTNPTATSGSGTVTSVGSGQGLTGGPITSSGTLACIVPFQSLQVYSTHGSNTFTTPAYSTQVYVVVIGAGGGGAGGSAGGNGGGGGGGGYSAGFLTVAGSIGYTVVVGTGGSAGGTGSAGGNGGNSTFSNGSTTVTGAGGTGGPFNAGGGAAGAGSNGTLNLPGQNGQGAIAGGGAGGGPYSSGPGAPSPGIATVGIAGAFPGSAGSGGGSGGATTGGAGADGLVLIYY